MNTKEKKYIDCERCVYAIKSYTSMGYKLFLNNVCACARLERPTKEKPFVPIKNCLYFRKDILPLLDDDTGQKLHYLSRQIEEITNITMEILTILQSKSDDGTEQEITEGSDADE